jgi:hypothetical protein
MIADHAHLKRDTRSLAVSYGRIVSRVGKRHRKVGLEGVFLRQGPPELLPDGINVSTEDVAVRPRKIDELEDAEASPSLGEGLERPKALLVDDDDFPRFDVSYVFRVNQVEGAGLGGDDIGVIEPSQARGRQPFGSRMAMSSPSVIRTQE